LIKTITLFLFSITTLFSAKIGFLCMGHCPELTGICFSTNIGEKLNSFGHEYQMVLIPYHSYPNLDSFDLLVSIHDFRIPNHYKNKTILYMLEPPVVIPQFASLKKLTPYKKIFSWNHKIADNKKYYKAFFAAFNGLNPHFKNFSERKFACLINSELSQSFPHPKQLYSKRAQIAKYYNRHYPASLSVYGGDSWKRHNLSIHKGFCNDKHKVLRDHKFSFCLENWDNDEYYISEKIFHCMQNRCVPIYLGSSKIGDYIPKEVYIDLRKFKSMEALHEYIANMSEDRWLQYIKAIERFCQSEDIRKFSPEKFINRISKVIIECLNE
jgi:alpha(1,3/1,4) fucosyltransferase